VTFDNMPGTGPLGYPALLSPLLAEVPRRHIKVGRNAARYIATIVHKRRSYPGEELAISHPSTASDHYILWP
jgi:hypothetical protein